MNSDWFLSLVEKYGWSAWFGGLVVIALSPGPGNIAFASAGTEMGFRRSIPFLLGANLALSACALVVGLLGDTVVDRIKDPKVFAVMKFICFGVLLYFAYLFFAAARKGARKESDQQRLFTFFDGVLLQITNPKVYIGLGVLISGYSMTSQITDSGRPAIGRVLGFTIAVFVVTALTQTVWTLAGEKMVRRLFSGTGKGVTNYFFALVFAVLAFFILFVPSEARNQPEQIDDALKSEQDN